MAHRRLLHLPALFLVIGGVACSAQVPGNGAFGSSASGADAGGSDGATADDGDGDGGPGPGSGGESTGGWDDGDGTGPGPATDGAGSDDGANDGPGPGPSTTGGDPGDGPCGCGFPAWACDTSNFHGVEGTEGPMPPLCGGGSGLGDGPPNTCFGGNFGTYSDVNSFCNYIVGRWTYLENECGNFGTATLTIDPALNAIADAAARDVADGAYPKGQLTCGSTPCGALDGPTFNLGGGASWFYIDGWQGQHLTKDAMFTAPETSMIIQSNAVWSDQQGNPIYERACQYNTEFSNAILYHYCDWEGMGVWGDPSTQPSRVGCGVAVDTEGVTWRVVKLGA